VTAPALRAPFPYFGGKSRAASIVWTAFGDLPNYVEPFAGSLAVLLARPTAPRIETVNDIDASICNFWRALKDHPEEVASWADWPINETDLHARHIWLVARLEKLKIDLLADPEYSDPKFAGWWVWGICQWIGSGWCVPPEWKDTRHRGVGQPRPSAHAQGIQAAHQNSRPSMRPSGVHSKRPRLAAGGRGVTCTLPSAQIPNLGGSRGAAGHGIHASGLSKKKPRSDRGRNSRLQGGAVLEWMLALAERLRRVRVCSGDWKRVMGPAVTTCIGVTGVMLDPPYSDEADRDSRIYGHDSLTVAHEVREWALANGEDKKLRIALCGYEGEHAMPASWQCIAWKASGGYAASAGNASNGARERIWFSPHCNGVRQADLFSRVQ
jgi:DNA adenine methylase